MTEDEISYKIRGSIFKVYNELGPGLYESVYQDVLLYVLRNEGLVVRDEVEVPVYYEGVKMKVGFRLDLLVENKVIVEIKSVENLARIHHKQVINYLRLTKKKLAILVNFNVDNITKGIVRKVNNL